MTICGPEYLDAIGKQIFLCHRGWPTGESVVYFDEP
jgi:hypothetical protein